MALQLSLEVHLQLGLAIRFFELAQLPLVLLGVILWIGLEGVLPNNLSVIHPALDPRGRQIVLMRRRFNRSLALVNLLDQLCTTFGCSPLDLGFLYHGHLPTGFESTMCSYSLDHYTRIALKFTFDKGRLMLYFISLN
jgi:hypothetical protein